MSNIKTGITTSKGFSDKMKELGISNVSAAFPAETLRVQLDEISEDTGITFNATNETVLETLNDGPVVSEYELLVHGPEGTTYVVKAGNKVIDPETAGSYAVPAGKNVKITASLTGKDDLVYSYKATENKNLLFDFENGEVVPYAEVEVTLKVTNLKAGEYAYGWCGDENLSFSDENDYTCVVTRLAGTVEALQIENENYAIYEDSITFNETKEISIELLKSATAYFKNESSEDVEVDVYKDGTKVTETPKSFFYAAGKENTSDTFVAKASGYQDKEFTLTYDGTEPTVTMEVAL